MCKFILVSGLVTLLFAACDPAEKPMTRYEFCQERATRECSSVAPACLVPEADCLSVRQPVCNSQAAAEDPIRPFDPANAKACLEKVSAVYGVLDKNLAIDAKSFLSIDDACSRVFHGAAKANQVCGIDADCAGTPVCDKGHCGTRSSVGPGDGCANIGQTCPQGYWCDGSSGVALCAPRPGFGLACSEVVPCQETLRCANATCVARLALSVACQAHGDCVSGFCEPYASKCADSVRFADGTPSCRAYQSVGPARHPADQDASADPSVPDGLVVPSAPDASVD
jgi:hypothetical protein